MKSFYIEKDFGKLHYVQVGEGKLVMICFPGFGQSANTFSRILSSEVKLCYTFYIIDMFYEGKSMIYNDSVLSFKCWTGYFNDIKNRHNLKDYTVLAYSIGARLALSLENAQKLILVAPDGINNHIIFHLIANHKVIGVFLIWLSTKIRVLTKFNKFLSKWTNPLFVYKLVKVWRVLSDLPNLNLDIPTTVYIGSNDVIAENMGIKKWVLLSDNRRFYEFKKGHFSLLIYILKHKI